MKNQDMVDVTEEMDYNELSATLGNFAFSKESKSENKKVDVDTVELSKRQDEKVLTKRRLADEEELKEFERRKEAEENESIKKKPNSSRRKKVAIRKIQKEKRTA